MNFEIFRMTHMLAVGTCDVMRDEVALPATASRRNSTTVDTVAFTDRTGMTSGDSEICQVMKLFRWGIVKISAVARTHSLQSNLPAEARLADRLHGERSVP